MDQFFHSLPDIWSIFAAGFSILSLSRLALLFWQTDRVNATGKFAELLLQGSRADLMLIGLMLIVPLLLLPLAQSKSLHRSWRRFSYGCCLCMLCLIIFVELSTPQFIANIAKYDFRPNRL